MSHLGETAAQPDGSLIVLWPPPSWRRSRWVTDRTACYLRVLEEVLPEAWHRMERYANNRIEADHAQLKRQLRPTRGLKTNIGARTAARVL